MSRESLSSRQQTHWEMLTTSHPHHICSSLNHPLNVISSWNIHNWITPLSFTSYLSTHTLAAVLFTLLLCWLNNVSEFDGILRNFYDDSKTDCCRVHWLKHGLTADGVEWDCVKILFIFWFISEMNGTESEDAMWDRILCNLWNIQGVYNIICSSFRRRNLIIAFATKLLQLLTS